MLMQAGRAVDIAKHFELSQAALRRKILSDLDLESDFNCELRTLLGINLSADSLMSAASGLLLTITEKSPLKKTIRVWESLTAGGSSESIEILPDGNYDESDSRYIVELDYETPILLRIFASVADKAIPSLSAIEESPVMINRALFYRLTDMFNHPEEHESKSAFLKYMWPILLCDIESRIAFCRRQ